MLADRRVLAPIARSGELARIAAVICVPVLVALAITLLAIGRSTTTAVLERIGLTGVLLWVIAGARLGWRLRRPGSGAANRRVAGRAVTAAR